MDSNLVLYLGVPRSKPSPKKALRPERPSRSEYELNLSRDEEERVPGDNKGRL